MKLNLTIALLIASKVGLLGYSSTDIPTFQIPDFVDYHEPDSLALKVDSTQFGLAYRFVFSKDGICVTLLFSTFMAEIDPFRDRWLTNGGIIEISYLGTEEKTTGVLTSDESLQIIIDFARSELFVLPERQECGMPGDDLIYAESFYRGEKVIVCRMGETSIPAALAKDRVMELASKFCSKGTRKFGRSEGQSEERRTGSGLSF